MYILTKLEPHYETTHTQLLYASEDITALQDILLTIKEENEFELFNFFINIEGITIDNAITATQQATKNFMDKFDIIAVPIIY